MSDLERDVHDLKERVDDLYRTTLFLGVMLIAAVLLGLFEFLALAWKGSV